MALQTLYLDAASAYGMVERLEKGQQRFGQLSLLRNAEWLDGTWKTRRGWSKVNLDAMPVNRFIGAHWYRDTSGNPHWLAAGDNGILYTSADEDGLFWAAVAVVAEHAMTWDATYRMVFADDGDDCFLCVSQPQESADAVATTVQNLRFDGQSSTPLLLAYTAYGVSLGAPVGALTLVDAGVGVIPYGVYSYKGTFRIAGTTIESAPTAIATITLTRPEAPQLLTLTATEVPAAGTIPAGVYLCGVTFYDAAGHESFMGAAIAQLTVGANAAIALAGVPICPEAGVGWTRRLWLSSAGGTYYLQGTIANNTAQAANIAAFATVTAYDAHEVGRSIGISTIPLSAAVGVAIHRLIYRSDDGGDYTELVPVGNADTIEDNTTVIYADVDEAATGETFVERRAVPPMAFVAGFSDNVLVWAGDRGDVLPARVYPSVDDSHPESLALLTAGTTTAPDYAQVGSDSDPITAFRPIRDHVFVGKQHSIFLLGRRCKTSDCVRIIEGVGVVNHASTIVIDTRVAFLSAEGPRLLTHYLQGGVIFCGSNPHQFDLNLTWESSVRERLHYATAVHFPAASCVIWSFQACESWPTDPAHNDTCIIWDYSDTNENSPGGKCWIADIIGLDAGFSVLPLGCRSPEPYTGFAVGWIGKLFDGYHGDGTTAWLGGTILSVDGTDIEVATSELEGEDVTGSVLWIRRGTGSRMGTTITPCSLAAALIVQQTAGSGGTTRLRTAGAITTAVGDKYTIGGFQFRPRFMVNNTRDPDCVTRFQTASVEVV